MAGKPGMKGGGGKRPGAGRKPAAPVFMVSVQAGEQKSPDDEPDSIRVMREIVKDSTIDVRVRLDAAKALAPYEMARKGEAGKKDERQQAAKKVSAGKFAPTEAPPRLRAVT